MLCALARQGRCSLGLLVQLDLNYGALEEFGCRDDHFEEDGQIKSSIALDVFMRRPYERKSWNDLMQEEAASASELIRQEKMLPFRTPGKPSRTPITSEEAYAATRPTLRSEAYEESSQTRQHDSSRGAPERSRASYERER